MFRILFWIFVVAGLAAFFGVLSLGPKHFTAEQQMMIFGLVVDLVMVVLTAYGIGMLIYGFKKGSVILAGKYGAKAFSREAQPFGYWACMAFYVCWIAFCLYALYVRNRELVHIL